ncbi:MAG: DUF6370 family protein [Acidobacteriota bacterium]|nr:DUF6370 family protein [Acidobacteriota bacterium]
MKTTLTRREVMMTLGALAVAMPAWAADEALKGYMVCAKCFLKKPDAKECQDILLVANASGEPTEYYVTKNDVAKESGEACTTKIPATITGTVSEQDGRKWITATKIVK